MPTLLLDSEADCADDLFMFVRWKKRRKDGKEHRYWSVVENVRVRGGRVVQRQVCCIWGRSTTASVRRGAARSRLWKGSRVRGRLTDVIVLCVCAVVSGAEGWCDIEESGRTKDVEEPFGATIPSRTGNADFGRVEPEVDVFLSAPAHGVCWPDMRVVSRPSMPMKAAATESSDCYVPRHTVRETPVTA